MIYSTSDARRAARSRPRTPARSPRAARCWVAGALLRARRGGAVIGRSRDCDIVLDDAASRAATPRSARRRTAGRSRTSARPTACCVNGRPLRGREPLHAATASSSARPRSIFELGMTSLAPVSVALKFGFLAVLYLFLLWVARSALRDLRGAARLAADARGAADPARRDRACTPASTLGSGRLRPARPAAGGRARPRARAGDDLRPRRRHRARPRRPRRDPPRGPVRLLPPRPHLRAGQHRGRSKTSAPPTAPISTRSCCRRRGRCIPAIACASATANSRSRSTGCCASPSSTPAPTPVASAVPTRTRCWPARRCSWSPTGWAARRPARSPRGSPSRPSRTGCTTLPSPSSRSRRSPRRRTRASTSSPTATPSRRAWARRSRRVYVGERGGGDRARRRQPRLLPARRRAAAAHRRPLARRRADAPGQAHARGGRRASAALDHHARARARGDGRGRHALLQRPRRRRLPALQRRSDDDGRRGAVAEMLRAHRAPARRGRGADRGGQRRRVGATTSR